MSTFRVVQRYPVVVYQERVLLETDDWLEAEAFVVRKSRPSRDSMQQDIPLIRGVHPSHDFATEGNPTCRNEGCRSWNNGSYGSHAPCGYDFGGQSLMHHIALWNAGRS